MHASHRTLVEIEPVRFLHDVDVSRPYRVIVVPDLVEEFPIRPVFQHLARSCDVNTGFQCQRFSQRLAHFVRIETCLFNPTLVQVQIGPVIKANQAVNPETLFLIYQAYYLIPIS